MWRCSWFWNWWRKWWHYRTTLAVMSSTEALNCKWSKKCISCSCFAVLTNWTLFILLRSWVICVSIIEEEILFPRAHTIIASRSQENWPFNILRNNVLMIQRPWNKSLHLWQFLGILAFQVTNVTKYGFFFPWPHYYITIKKKKSFIIFWGSLSK